MRQNEMQKIWEEVLQENKYDPMALMEILLDIQDKCGCVTMECMSFIAEKLAMDEDYVYSVATFYDYFTLEENGKYVITICNGTSCHLKHSEDILDELRRELGLHKSTDTTSDKLFTVKSAGKCMGACWQGPVLKVNGVICPSMTVTKAKQLVRELRLQEQEESVMEVVRKLYEGTGRGECHDN